MSIILSSNKEIKAAFVRGLADSDFCFITTKNNMYPRIQGASKSKTLIEQTSFILRELGIDNNVQVEKTAPNRDRKRFIS